HPETVAACGTPGRRGIDQNGPKTEEPKRTRPHASSIAARTPIRARPRSLHLRQSQAARAVAAAEAGRRAVVRLVSGSDTVGRRRAVLKDSLCEGRGRRLYSFVHLRARRSRVP